MKHILFILLIFCFHAVAQVPIQRERSYDIMLDSDPHIAVKPNHDEPAKARYYKHEGKYGFVYPKDVKQDAVYDEIRSILNGFIIKKGNFYGIADANGKEIGKIDFDSIGFQRNVCIIKKKGKYGTMTTDGIPLLSLKYDKILFSDAVNPVSFVKNKKGDVQLIFNASEKPFPHKIDYSELYSNLVIIKSNGKFGVVKNQTVIPFEYDSIYVPSTASNYNNTNIKKQGKKSSFTFNYGMYSKKVNCLAIQKNDKYGLADSDGNIIYPPENDAVNNVELKQYFTVRKEKLYGIYFVGIRKKTEIEFDKVYSDGVGYVMAVKNKKAGVFNLQGEQIIPFEYDDEFISQYTGIGLRVSKNKKRGIIDTKGNIIIPTVYDDISTFYQTGFSGFFKVKSGEKYGVINLNGETVIPIEFGGVYVEKDFFNVVTPKPDRKFGLYDRQGNVVVPAIYNWITDSDTQYSRIMILKKDDVSYNFLDHNHEIIFTEDIEGYGYVLNQDRLLNPFSSTEHHLLFVKDKKGKTGMLNEMTGTLAIPIVYDEIMQRFDSREHIYYSVRKGKKHGLINEKNEQVIPIEYDAISIDLVQTDYNDEIDETYTVVVAKDKKFGAVNLKNEVQIPFQYDDLQRISNSELYKAKTGKYYKIINSKNEIIHKGPFDEVANFEQTGGFEYGEDESYKALTFYNGKMKVINHKGIFISSETDMIPHNGYKTFDELKFALIEVLDSPDDNMLKIFIEKIAPSQHILYYLKNNLFNNSPLSYINIDSIKENYYYQDLLKFKYQYWDKGSGYGYNRHSLTDVTDYTVHQNDGYVTNRRNTDHAFGDVRFMEKLLRNAIKINGYWISTYFMRQTY